MQDEKANIRTTFYSRLSIGGSLKRTFLYFFILCIQRECLALSDKQLDNFSAATFGNCFISGLTGSTSTTQFKEGVSSLKIDYNLTAGNFGEVFRGYSTNTLDLSFNPVSLSLWVKGQAAQFPQFRLMLYEDINMNGNPFDPGDEIFEFTSNTIISNTAWTQITMPYASFTKFGGGVGTLDLNRIYAWRIYLLNTTGATITGTLYLDDLRQNTSYTAPASGTAKINGAFLQLWGDNTCGFCGSWTQAQWEAQFNYMKSVCIDKVVIQYGVYNTVTWYMPSALPGVTSYNTMNTIFNAADNTGMKVYTGVYYNGEFDQTTSADPAFYNNLYFKNQTVVNEIYGLFGTRASFQGWYIPQEIHDLYWRSATDRNLLANWLQNVGNYAKSKDGTKKVMIAPFYGPWAPADYVQSWYDAVLTTATSIDIVMPQDGCGTYAGWGMGPPLNKDIDVDVPNYFNAIKNACTLHGVTFAADVETFSDPSPRAPAPIARIKSQLWEAALHTTEIYQFAWLYMQPGLSAGTQQLYDDYKRSYAPSCLPLGLSNKNSGLANSNSAVQAQIKVYSENYGDGLDVFFKPEPGFVCHDLTIFDLRGKILYQSNFISDVIHLKVSPGMYILNISNQSKPYQFKLIKE
jgi:hypothetical protein